jgi:hypothetical protein
VLDIRLTSVPAARCPANCTGVALFCVPSAVT